MGLYDRDYMRAPPAAPVRRRAPAPGRLKRLQFFIWLLWRRLWRRQT